MNAPDARVHYIHRISYTVQERLVGAFVLVALVLLGMLAIFSREASTFFAEKFTLVAMMKDARGVVVETPVLMSGVEVGRVEKLEVVADGNIRVELEMLERYHPLVHEDAKATLSKLSLLGKPSIELQGGSPGRAAIEDNSIVPLAEPPNLDEMLAELTPTLQNVQKILERLNAITSAIEPGQVRAVTGNLQRASGDLPPLVHEARGAVAQVGTTVDSINVELEQLPDLVQRTHQVMDQMDRTLTGVQNTWPLSSSMEPKSDKQVVEARPQP